MIGFDEAARLVRLQERVKAATLHELRKDGHHKSGEAHVSLAFNLPAMFADDQRPYWSIEVFSYVLCDVGRSQTWTGHTAAEAIAKAEDGVGKWCLMPEMEQFEAFMGGQDAPDEEDLPA